MKVEALRKDIYGPVFSQPIREEIINYLPFSMRSPVVRQFIKTAGRDGKNYVAANQQLAAIKENVVKPDLLMCGDFRLTNSDEALCDWADSKAKTVKRALIIKGYEVAQEKGQELSAFYGFEPLEITEDVDLLSVVARYTEAKYWRRKMRTKKAQVLDQLARDLRIVNAREQIYVSDEAYKNRRARKVSNRELLERMEAENQHGDKYTLAELSDTSVSNPENRRNELMVRIRGFEEVALMLGHSCDFLTITCPSKYHPTTGTRPNPNYQGFTPKQANDYLVKKVWAGARKELDKAGLKVYGMRVAEPHSDGTPHWHLMLFSQPKDFYAIRTIIKKHALLVDGQEKGAAKYRFKAVKIDPSKGSAAGYIAKYIAKNVDGFAVDQDLYGKDAASSAQRIVEWSGTWGIRQFQQVGGAGVTVWRELRRLKKEQLEEWKETLKVCGEALPALAEEARKAADSADWAAYTLLMGGVYIARKDRPIKLLMMKRPARNELEKVNRLTGEVSCDRQTAYNGAVVAVKGVLVKGVMVVTRWFDWVIKPVGVLGVG